MRLRTVLNRLKPLLPWWAKVLAKIVLARLPLPYRVWKRLGVFEHGTMEDPAYALRIVQQHIRAAYGSDSFRHVLRSNPAAAGHPPTMLELGPGDSIFGGMAAWALGGQRVILVDAGAHAPIEVASCQAMATYLASQGLPAPMIPASADALEVLGACGIEYLTAGLQSLRDLPSASVDFVFSQAVLEHIRRAEFAPTMRELRRVLRPEGRCSHVVDLEDHLAGGLNNLRFRPDLWESPWMANSGFYTNRLRHCEVVRILSECGFTVQSIELQHWPALPIDRGALHEAFRAFDDDELRIRGFCVVLAPA